MTSQTHHQPTAAELAEQFKKNRSAQERRADVDAFRARGEEGIQALCDLLKHRDYKVRTQAADILMEIGDARAVQPLLDALRDCFVGRSSRWQIVVGFTVVPLVFLLILVAAVGVLWQAAGCAYVIFQAISAWVSRWWERRPHEVTQSIANALARIAEREPTPQLRAAIPDLSLLAADVLQQKRQTRETARAAAQRIADLTEQLKSLPIPASMPTPSVEGLPIPASEPSPDTATLPRPSQSVDDTA